jgi:protein-S-isoprenylcysteine O-methyltransferase Ste14
LPAQNGVFLTPNETTMQVYDSFPFVGFCFILMSLSIKIILLKKKEIKVGTEKKIGKTPVSLYFLFGFIFIIWLFEIVKPAFQLSFSILPGVFTKILFQHRFLKISGAVFIFISLILWIITLVHFKTSLRFGLNENNPGKLITSGIFSLSRNPFFLSLNIYFLGITLIFTNLFFIGLCFLAFVSIHFFILKEEKLMQRIYGKEYKNYRRKVRRYF